MTRNSQNKVVILDLGNVVLDWDVDRILDSLEIKTEERTLLQKELFFHQDWLDMDEGKSSESAVISAVCARSSLNRNVVNKALLAAKNSLLPIPESIALMKEISDYGIEMFCLSNMSRETYDHIKNRPLFGMFNGIVISGVEKCMKPDTDIFHLIIDRFGLETMEIVFIDDSLDNIETSRRLGINGFHFRRTPKCYSGIRNLLF